MLASSIASARADDPPAEVVIRPEPAPGPLNNPLKGWCPYTDAGPIRQPYSMVFLYAPWKELEPEEGRYAFEQWERRAWAVPEAEGKHVVLRVYIDYPGRPSGLPDWLKDRGVRLTPYEDHGGGLSPDYDDPRMVAALERLIEAMGRRYNEHPRVAFLQLGLLGFSGEWHTWPRSELYASPQTERRVIEAYRRAFPDTLLQARYARGFAGEQPWLGFHDDMFPEDTDNGRDWSFLAGLRRSGRTDNWRRAAIGGEMVPHQATAWLGPEYRRTVEMLERGHFTWIGPYCPALGRSQDPEFRRRSEALVRRMGYQFRLDEIRHLGSVVRGGPLKVSIRGENQGVAPFYCPWPAELALLDEAGGPVERLRPGCDVRSWLPGPFEVEEEVGVQAPAGRYRLALGIIDPWTDRPSIAFANELGRQGGWAVLSALVVEAGR
jgi:hypothetical protein